MVMQLDPALDPASLVPSEIGAGSIKMDADTGTLVWEIGRLGAGEQARTAFDVNVSADAEAGQVIVGHATLYFPSSLEEMATNLVVNNGLRGFGDILWGYWAYAYIGACVKAGIVVGYPDGSYRPTLPVDRASMAVFVARAIAGGDSGVLPGPATNSFSDVLADHWAYKWIEYGVSQNVVQGYPDGTYRPTVQVDRGQMAVFIARGIVAPKGDAAVPTGPAVATFPDVPTDHWAYQWVEFIADQAVTQGYEDGTYRPAVIVSRDQMAVFVQRAFDLPM
jgi:hypothetical protein